ncbi:uncharacterized protein LOC126910144, partial [Daktulosphaira vitifoliae]|uniref:uncharacterized protein LOC126910144 n=1 Tax=Daktulosphaira vitifoliae TaxID=58002 RepID=UPI0021AA19E2
GQMNKICTNCKAYYFDGEQNCSGQIMLCCQGGKVLINHDIYPEYMVRDPPEILQELLSGNHHLSKNYLQHIRQFNNSLAFASLVVKQSYPLILQGRGPKIVKVHGQAYTAIAEPQPLNGQPPRYAQLYMLDPMQAHIARVSNSLNAGCDAELMHLLENMLMTINNPF